MTTQHVNIHVSQEQVTSGRIHTPAHGHSAQSSRIRILQIAILFHIVFGFARQQPGVAARDCIWLFPTSTMRFDFDLEIIRIFRSQ